MNTTTVSAQTNNVGSAILALSGLLSRTFRKQPTGRQIKCEIALVKAGVIRPIDDRVKSGKSLTAEAYKTFTALSKSKDEAVAKGAATVLKIANELVARGKEIAAYKAAQPAA